MVDFTMCANQECLLGDQCDRQTAQRSKRQSFAYFAPEKGGQHCESMIPNEKHKAFLILSGRERELEPKFDFQTLGRLMRDGENVKIRFIDYPSTLYWSHTIPKSKP